jgi:F0F1-type ATP synthase assembly protein I
MGRSQSNRDIVRFSSAGIELVLFVLLFLYGGYKLDGKLETLPVFTLVGGIIGMIVGFYMVFRTLIAGDGERNKKDSNSSEQR